MNICVVRGWWYETHHFNIFVFIYAGIICLTRFADIHKTIYPPLTTSPQYSIILKFMAARIKTTFKKWSGHNRWLCFLDCDTFTQLYPNITVGFFFFFPAVSTWTLHNNFIVIKSSFDFDCIYFTLQPLLKGGGRRGRVVDCLGLVPGGRPRGLALHHSLCPRPSSSARCTALESFQEGSRH